MPEPLDLMAGPTEAAELRAAMRDLPSWTLLPRQLCDLELLLSGGFAPLRGFLGERDHARVCAEMRLASGALWPMPIALDVPEPFAATLQTGKRLVLRTAEGTPLAVMQVEELYRPDREKEAQQVFGTTNRAHPGVNALLGSDRSVYVGGAVRGLSLPAHHDFRELRHTPAQLRAEFARRGWDRVVAFQTRNPMHRAHVELTRRAAQQTGAGLLIHPSVGQTKPGDVDHYTRVRGYRALLPRFAANGENAGSGPTAAPSKGAMLSLLPLAMRMGGPREALWHALIRKNHGCTHFIVGRDHAGPGKAPDGTPWYGPYDAQQLVRTHAAEAGIAMVPFEEMVHVKELDAYMPAGEVPKGRTVQNLSGTELRDRLATGGDIPEWFSYPEVVAELRRSHPPRAQQGFTVFFTGLSGAGKSTIANVLHVKLLELGGRRVTVLDGDHVRQHLSSELGFSKEHRNLNITRIGYVASEITKHGGAAICAPIAPYAEPRRQVRQLVEPYGGFVLVHVATRLEVCEGRDRKGLYAKARAGLIGQFTGISDPYEEPTDAEIVIDTERVAEDDAAAMILRWLETNGYLPRAS